MMKKWVGRYMYVGVVCMCRVVLWVWHGSEWLEHGNRCVVL